MFYRNLHPCTGTYVIYIIYGNMHGNIDIYGDDFDPVSIFAQFANKLTQRAFANKGWILNYLNLESLLLQKSLIQ